MMKNTALYHNYVAEFHGDIVGFISLVIYKTFFHSGGTALINELIIDVKYRGKGLGTKLIDKAKEISIKKNVNELEVGTTRMNRLAIDFYRKNGLTDEAVILGMEINE